MKKIDFEKLNEQDMFERYQSNKLNTLVSYNLKAGLTSTTLCTTHEEADDTDNRTGGESFTDPRCYS